MKQHNIFGGIDDTEKQDEIEKLIKEIKEMKQKLKTLEDKILKLQK